MEGIIVGPIAQSGGIRMENIIIIMGEEHRMIMIFLRQRITRLRHVRLFLLMTACLKHVNVIAGIL